VEPKSRLSGSSGRATPSLSEALAQAEEQVKTLTADIVSMELANQHVFTPPPHDLLSHRTEKSALALRRLTGPVTLTPQPPDVGRPYFRVACKFDSLNLLVADGGSNLLRWWRRGELNPGPRGIRSAFVHVRSRITQAAGFEDSACGLAPESLGPAVGSTDEAQL
jgi:hypothetical protein